MATDDRKPAPSTRIVGAPASGGGNTDDVETHVLATAQDRVVGWLSIVDGPGKGQRRAVHTGTNAIGRDAQSNRLVLDFGDDTVSRTGHAIIVYEAGTRSFRLVDGGKGNRVKVNGKDVVAAVVLKPADIIEIGQTRLRFETA